MSDLIGFALFAVIWTAFWEWKIRGWFFSVKDKFF